MRNAGLDEAQAGIKIAQGNINNLRQADDTPYGRKRRTKKPLDEIKSEIAGSTLRKLTSWHPVPSLHGKQMGKQWKQWLTLFFEAPKLLQMVTAAMKLKDAYSLEGKL